MNVPVQSTPFLGEGYWRNILSQEEMQSIEWPKKVPEPVEEILDRQDPFAPQQLMRHSYMVLYVPKIDLHNFGSIAAKVCALLQIRRQQFPMIDGSPPVTDPVENEIDRTTLTGRCWIIIRKEPLEITNLGELNQIFGANQGLPTAAEMVLFSQKIRSYYQQDNDVFRALTENKYEGSFVTVGVQNAGTELTVTRWDLEIDQDSLLAYPCLRYTDAKPKSESKEQ